MDLSEEENRGFQTVGEFDFPKGVVKIKLYSPQNNGYFRFSAARFTQLSAEPTPDIWEGTPKPTYQPPDGTVIVHIYDGKDPRQNIGFYETKGDWSGSKGQEETFHYIDPVNKEGNSRYTEEGEAVIVATIPEEGVYSLYYYVSGLEYDSRCMNMSVYHKAWESKFEVDLSDESKQGFQKIGEFDFEEGTIRVKISGKKEDGFVRYSALKFVAKGDEEPTPSPKPTKTPAPTLEPGVVPGDIIITNGLQGYQESGGEFRDSALYNAVGRQSRYSMSEGSTITYTPTITADAEYEVFYYVMDGPGGDPQQKVNVYYDGGMKTVRVDCSKARGWVFLGVYPFAKGTSGSVSVSKSGQDGQEPYIRSAGVYFAYAGSTGGINEEGIVKIADYNNSGDSGFHELQGQWIGSDNSTLGISYRDPDTGNTFARLANGPAEAEVEVTLPQGGKYRVSYFVSGWRADTDELIFTVDQDGQTQQVTLDLSDESQRGFQKVGVYEFPEGKAKIRLTSPKEEVFLRFSAMKFELVDEDTPEDEKQLPQPFENFDTDGIYRDIGEDYSWAKNAIGFLTSKGIVEGKGDGQFDPQAEVTRAEFVKMAVAMMDVPLVKYRGGLSDAPAEEWYADYLQTALDYQIIDPKMVEDGMFHPDQPITREEMTSVIAKAYEAITQTSLPSGEEFTFTDQEEFSDWAEDYAKSAAALEIVLGVGDGAFEPKEKADRAQAAVIVNRMWIATRK